MKNKSGDSLKPALRIHGFQFSGKTVCCCDIFLSLKFQVIGRFIVPLLLNKLYEDTFGDCYFDKTRNDSIFDDASTADTIDPKSLCSVYHNATYLDLNKLLNCRVNSSSLVLFFRELKKSLVTLMDSSQRLESFSDCVTWTANASFQSDSISELDELELYVIVACCWSVHSNIVGKSVRY
jgi:hypothetical protein